MTSGAAIPAFADDGVGVSDNADRTASTGQRAFRPIPLATTLAVAALVAAATWTFRAGSLPSWMPPLWAEANAMPRDAVLAVGPIVAAGGAWIGGTRHTTAVGALAGRGWSRIAFAQLAPLAVSVILGCFVGLLPTLVRTADLATAGTINPLVILSGWLADLVLLVGGYVIGVAWSSRLAPVVAVIGALSIIVAPSWLNEAFAGSIEAGRRGTSFYSIAFVWFDFAAGPGQHEVRGATAQRLLLFTAALGATALAAVRFGEPGRHRRLGALAPFLVPVAIGAVMLAKQPYLITATSGAEACQRVSGSQVCVPKDISALLPAFSSGAERVVGTFGYGALDPATLQTTPLSDYVFIGIGDSPGAVEDDATIATARAVAGMSACEVRANGDAEISEGGALAVSYEHASDLAYVLAVKAGSPQHVVDARLFVTDSQAVNTLERLTDADFQRFLTDRSAQLRSCTLSSLSPGE